MRCFSHLFAVYLRSVVSGTGAEAGDGETET